MCGFSADQSGGTPAPRRMYSPGLTGYWHSPTGIPVAGKSARKCATGAHPHPGRLLQVLDRANEKRLSVSRSYIQACLRPGSERPPVAYQSSRTEKKAQLSSNTVQNVGRHRLPARTTRAIAVLE